MSSFILECLLCYFTLPVFVPGLPVSSAPDHLHLCLVTCSAVSESLSPQLFPGIFFALCLVLQDSVCCLCLLGLILGLNICLTPVLVVSEI